MDAYIKCPNYLKVVFISRKNFKLLDDFEYLFDIRRHLMYLCVRLYSTFQDKILSLKKKILSLNKK